MKRIENIEGKTGRDYEIGFTIEKSKANSHFGRSIQPERLDETYGKITDEDIAHNSHPLIVDNFFCSDCEERLGLIESKYSKTIVIVKETDYKSGISNSNGILFWASVFWRMAVHGKSGIKLTTEKNESLRIILDSFLPRKNENLNEEEFAVSNIVKGVSYKVIRCHNLETVDPKWLLFHPEFHNSFCLFIDEFVVVFSLNGQFEEFERNDCFGINNLILKAPTNNSTGDEVIRPFDRSVFMEYGKKIVNKIKKIYVSGLDELFDKLHVAAGGKGDKMPVDLKREIMAEITSNKKKPGRRYTQEDIVKSTYKIMKKYAP